jgi:hypothetical protein
MFDPALEAHVAGAVRALLSAPDDDGAGTHQLCEATGALLETFLQLADDWPEHAYIDGLMPLSLELGEGALQLAAAAVVEQDDGWVLQPLLASFALAEDDPDALAALSLLFAYADREPPAFDPTAQSGELPLPDDAQGFRYRLESEPEAAVD